MIETTLKNAAVGRTTTRRRQPRSGDPVFQQSPCGIVKLWRTGYPPSRYDARVIQRWPSSASENASSVRSSRNGVTET